MPSQQRSSGAFEKDGGDRPVTSTVHADLEGRITFISEGAQEVFGYESTELVGRERVSVFSPGLVVLEHIPKWLKRSVAVGHFETDTVFVRKDGSRFAAHIRITPIVKEGVQTGYIGLTTPLPRQSIDEATPPISMKTRLYSWLYITRAPFLSVTVVAVLLGGLVAPWLVAGTQVDVGLLLLTLLGASLAHLGANSANDYFDWRSGTDDGNTDYVVPYSGGSRMIQLGVISPAGMLRTSLLLYALAAAVAVYLAATLGIWPQLLAVTVAGAALGFLYTAPPLRLAARGLGELAAALAFGPLLVAGAALVQMGSFEPRALLVGVPTGLLTASIIWINQFPDAVEDAAAGKRTLVVRLGLARSRWAYVVLWVGSFTVLVGLVVLETLPRQALMSLVCLPLALYVTRQLFLHFRARTIKTAMAGTINMHLGAGLLTCLGVWLAT